MAGIPLVYGCLLECRNQHMVFNITTCIIQTKGSDTFFCHGARVYIFLFNMDCDPHRFISNDNVHIY
jgi:hypothetical protein